jgi:protocatechuate 3,4-dioxygenase beta subunit
MHDHDEFGGLHRDLGLLGAVLKRRDMIRLAAGAGMLQLLGCGGEGNGNGTSDGCGVIPEETAGPFPADGSNGPDVLSQSGVVRSDIRSSFGSSTGTADGIPLTVTLTIVSASNDCAPLPSHAVYLWHCDREGRYSLYSAGVTDQNYLRGVQETDASGQVTFTTIFPACYTGRWPHIHFEVYPSLTAATDEANKIATSQLALPEATCNEVYATSGYEQSVTNLQQVSLTSDNVFGEDGGESQLATMSGTVAGGFTATLQVPV